MKSILVFLAVSFLVCSCGQDKKAQQDPVDPPKAPDGKAVTLLVWGAPWCTNCKKDLPEVQARLKEILGDRLKAVDFQLWVPFGATPADPPTAEVAELYRQKLQLEATVFVDEWMCKTYKKHLPEGNCKLPAGIVLNSQGGVIKKFLPGGTFVPADIAAVVAQNVK